MDYNEPIKCLKSLIAISKLFKKTYKSVIKRADKSANAARAPDKATKAFVSKTLACLLKEYALRST
jgi:hypothetical protein